MFKIARHRMRPASDPNEPSNFLFTMWFSTCDRQSQRSDRKRRGRTVRRSTDRRRALVEPDGIELDDLLLAKHALSQLLSYGPLAKPSKLTAIGDLVAQET